MLCGRRPSRVHDAAVDLLDEAGKLSGVARVQFAGGYRLIEELPGFGAHDFVVTSERRQRRSCEH